ncbi:MAG: hypothetical protein WBI57_13495 [Desulfobacterales bacterium]
MNDDFLYRNVPALGRRAFRLGLATNYGVEGVDRNVNRKLKATAIVK